MELKELEKYGVDIKEINMLIKKAKEDTTYLVVTGEFSAGKSCFINCLLNKEDFLPYGNTECTPILLDMYQGEESSLVVQHIDGSVDPIEYSTDNIERYAVEVLICIIATTCLKLLFGGIDNTFLLAFMVSSGMVCVGTSIFCDITQKKERAASEKDCVEQNKLHTAELKSVIRSNENLIEIINQIAKKQQEEYENNNVFKQDLLETVKRLLIKHDEIEETTEKKLEDIIDGMLGIKKQNHEFSDYLELVEKSQEKEIQIIERIEKSENEHLENLVNLIDSKIIDKLISVDNNITKFNSRTEKIQQVLDDTVGDLKIQSENIYNILNENVISMLEEDGAICNKLEEVDEKLENIDECLEDAIKDAIQEGLEMGSDKVLESIDNAIEDFNQKNDGMINSYDNLLEKINDVVARLTEDECKIIHEIRLAYKILERKNNTNN